MSFLNCPFTHPTNHVFVKASFLEQASLHRYQSEATEQMLKKRKITQELLYKFVIRVRSKTVDTKTTTSVLIHRALLHSCLSQLNAVSVCHYMCSGLSLQHGSSHFSLFWISDTISTVSVSSPPPQAFVFITPVGNQISSAL